MLALLTALLRAENDDHQVRGGPFSVSTDELARLSGLSAGSVAKCQQMLSGLGLIKIESGKHLSRENTYYIVEAGAPPARSLAHAPSSIDEIFNYVRNQGLSIRDEVVRDFWMSNEARQWMIAGKDGRRARPCRNWRKLFTGFANSYRPIREAQSAVQSTPPGGPPVGMARRAAAVKSGGSSLPSDLNLAVCARMLAINSLFGRTDEARWNEKELHEFYSAGIDQLCDEDFADQFGLLQEYHHGRTDWLEDHWQVPKGKDFRRKKILSLLQNWSEEVDKARGAAAYLRRRKRERDIEYGHVLPSETEAPPLL